MNKLIFLIPLAIIAGCTTISVISAGDNVSLDYTLYLSDGSIVDTSIGRAPLNFTAGAGQMIAGFDNAVIGMSAGEEKNFTVSPEDGYGIIREELIVSYDKDTLTSSIEAEPFIGMVLRSSNGPVGKVTNISDSNVTIDFNHELAGKNLTFTVKILSIEKM